MKTSEKKLLKTLGKRIKGLREKQGISQSQLAYECGRSHRQITRLEAGLQNTTVTTLASIAEALNVPLRDLMDLD